MKAIRKVLKVKNKLLKINILISSYIFHIKSVYNLNKELTDFSNYLIKKQTK